MPKVDLEKFRLRKFVRTLAELGEVEVVDRPVSFTELAAMVEASPKALHFKQAGPERFEMISGVLSSRRRVAAAFGLGEKELVANFAKRAHTPQAVLDIA